MSKQELQWLYETACKMDSIVEIGCWLGKSTHALLSGCPGPVYAVDHFRGSASQRTLEHREAGQRDISKDFLRNVGFFPNLHLLRMESLEAAKLFNPKSIDMVFIDGDHNYPYPLQDIRAWFPICKKLLCGHDMTEKGVPGSLRESKIKYKQAVHTIWMCDPMEAK